MPAMNHALGEDERYSNRGANIAPIRNSRFKRIRCRCRHVDSGMPLQVVQVVSLRLFFLPQLTKSGHFTSLRRLFAVLARTMPRPWGQ